MRDFAHDADTDEQAMSSRATTAFETCGGLDAQLWEPPYFSELPPEEPVPEIHLPTAAEVAAIEEAAREAGFESGFERGYREGRELGQTEAEKEGRARYDKAIREAIDALESIARVFADPLSEATDAIEPELLLLVTTVARRVVMGELSAQPERIATIVQQVLAQLPSRDRPIHARLHPEDCTLLQEAAAVLPDNLTCVADPTLARGGCILETGPSRIDASLETRLRRHVDALWGELQAPVADGAAGTPPDDRSSTNERKA